jgi:molecular chaperone HscB
MLKVLETAVPVACWSCSVALNESTLFCPHCNKIQPPPGGSYFSAFSLEPHLNLDLAALEREFHRLSRKLHPDRFARAGEIEKQWSLADTALLNDAYRTLKDPLRRTEYLLKLRGATIGEATAAQTPTELFQNQEKSLLEEVFDLNLQLEDFRAARKLGQEVSDLTESLLAAKRKLEAMSEAASRELRVQWNVWDEGDGAARQHSEQVMLTLLDRGRYLNNLVRGVSEVLEA